MTKRKILTIDEILKRKDILDKENYEYYHSEVYNMDIKVDDCDEQEILETISESGDSEVRRYYKLIYMSCPIFKSEELRTEFSHRIKEPYDVIKIVLNNNLSEVINLGHFILKKYGLLNDGMIENLKK